MSEWDEVYDFEPPGRWELRLEGVLLQYVADEFPVPITLFNCAIHAGRDPHDPVEADDVDRITRNLAASGLLHRVRLDDHEEQYAFPDGNMLLRPSKAAIHYRALANLLGML